MSDKEHNKEKLITVIGGGTGGHLFPAIATGEEMQRRGYRVKLITDVRCKKFLPSDFSIEYDIIKAATFKKSLWYRIKAAFKIIRGLFQSLAIFYYDRPSMVVGFGGYPTVPALLAAKFFNIPIALHEQNSYLGRANRFFCKYAKALALSFKDTLNIPEECNSKIVITGNPVRNSINECIPIEGEARSSNFHLLVFGGSQGSEFFTNLISNVLKLLVRKKSSNKIFITQQAPKREIARLKRVYKRLGIKYELAEFFESMPEKLGSADLAITRAGASTVAELIAAELPAILIPLPRSAHNHQYHNAMYLNNQKASWCFEQKVITPDTLAEQINELISNPKTLKTASNNLKNLQRNSDVLLTDTVEKIIHYKQP
jgi:UDP-N-acetylglucosamine--N-acetylmuramyl-(pentapeptide) pyrophosphoryl-undecaprenol N-acetylglucosamine transferase